MHTIKVDDEVFGVLQADIETFADTPNSVIRRKLGLDPAGNDSGETASAPQRAKSGTVLHGDEYRKPTLKAIANLGGAGRPQEVIDEAGRLLESKLLPEDFGKIPSGDIRWRNRVRWTAFRLRREGLLGGKRGLWELTDTGREAVSD